jgi:hypothetical protein
LGSVALHFAEMPTSLASLDRWEELVDKFLRLTSAGPVRHDIRALSEAVRVRGEAVTDFNEKLMNALVVAHVMEDTEAARVESLKTAASLNNPALPAALAFLARNYQHMKDATIKLVYLANRAYQFWMLDDGTARVPTREGGTHGTNVFREVLVAKGALGERGRRCLWGDRSRIWPTRRTTRSS